MFVGAPQPVEIHHRGIWYSGELVGWRHGDDGRVMARVRCVVDRLRHSTWKDLTELRLPDPATPPRREPYPAPLPRAHGYDPDEETRPHVLMAGLRTGPRKPPGAVAPPAPRVGEPAAPRPRPGVPAAYTRAHVGKAAQLSSV
jgi:hypothetical protein